MHDPRFKKLLQEFLMRVPKERKIALAGEALERLVHCPENTYRKTLLCECVSAYLPTDEEQRRQFEAILRNHPDPGVRRFLTPHPKKLTISFRSRCTRVMAMSAASNVYACWLGIESGDRPPNYYQLLGLRDFESHADQITNGAKRQIARVEAAASPGQAALAAAVIDQIRAAERCLSTPETKAAYERHLLAVRPSQP